MDPHRLSHMHHMADNNGNPGIDFERMQECQIQLNQIHRIILKDVQGRIPAAKIIQPDFISGSPEPVQHLLHMCRVCRQCRFGNFQIQMFRSQPVLFADGLNFLKDMAFLEINA